MSVALFGRARGVWTEADYLALRETSVKIELFDGALVMSPPPNLEHQDFARLLEFVLWPVAKRAGLRVYRDSGVRLARDRIAIPDVMVIDADVDLRDSVVDAETVQFVAEITSRGNARNDRVRKMNYYAEADIEHYLLVDRNPALAMRLYRLKNGQYIEEARAYRGSTLRLPHPLGIVIGPETFIED
jgi:Uma2 family endonuclease